MKNVKGSIFALDFFSYLNIPSGLKKCKNPIKRAIKSNSTHKKLRYEIKLKPIGK
jgi:hypothetical protein